MRSKWFFLLVATLATASLWGCGSSGGSGGSAVTPTPSEPEKLGNSSCQVCHTAAHTRASELVGSVSLADGGAYLIEHDCEDCHGGGQAHRGLGPIPYPQPTLERCAACHNDEIQAVAEANQHVLPNNEPDCAACHESLKLSVRQVGDNIGCVDCHTTKTPTELAANPFIDQITERFATGRHVGSARTNNCAACHSHEGALVMFSKDEKITTIAQIEAMAGELAELGATLSKKTCATCHEPHTGALRGPEPETQEVTLASGLKWERQVYSKEFQLCTSCHQVSLDVSFNPNAGDSNAGAFDDALSGVYAKSADNPDPYTNKGIGYHTNSHLNRSFVDTHFTGELYKKLYYYDVYLGYVKAGDLPGDNFVDVLYAALNRQRTERVTPDGPDYDRLVAFYEEYLASPDNVEIKGFSVNPGSDNACSACHDVHSANKLVVPAASPYPYAMNFEENIATAIAYGEGVAQNHADYTGNAFSRNVSNTNGDMYGSAGCTPCHTGRDFVKVTKGAAFADLGAAQWNVVACVSCHDMTASGAISDNVRTLPAGYEFAFNSEEVIDVALLGTNQVCFECHKGRTPGVDVAALTAGPTNHYDISYLHYSPTFATHYGTDSGMVAEYAGKDYRGKSTTHSANPANDTGGGLTYGVEGGASCVDCHDVHTGIKESSPNIRNGTTCVTCHGADWTLRATKGRVSDLASLLIDVVYDELMVTTNTGFNANLTAFLTALQSEADPSVAKETIKSRIKERTIAGGWPTKELAHAVTTWKVFYYEDKASWAHNRNYTYQMLHDAIESIGDVNDVAAATAIVARPI